MWPPGGSRAFSPYVDVTLTPPLDLAGVAANAGARSLTLAFIDSGARACEPAWGESPALSDPAVLSAAARLRAAGVALRISFGGARGEELAQSCPSVPALEAAYGSVLARYHAVAADFDLEGAALADRAAMLRRAQAIARLQAQSAGRFAVTLTLPVSSSGLSPSAMAAVREMRSAGVRLDAVNLLALDYGAAKARGRMATEAMLAIAAAHRQLAALGSGLGSWRALGVTVMVGINDVSGEVFTLADARTLARYVGRHGLGLISIWSLDRDQPCEGSPTAAQATCSGVGASPYAFSRVFGAHPRPGMAPLRAVDSS